MKTVFFSVLALFVLATAPLHAQQDSIFRNTGFSLSLSGVVLNYTIEPKEGLLGHVGFAAGYHGPKYNLYAAYNRGMAVNCNTNGIGFGGEVYLNKSKLSADLVIALKADQTTAPFTTVITLGAVAFSDNVNIFNCSFGYWRRIRNSKVFAGGMPVYQYGHREKIESGWLVNRKIEDITDAHALMLNAGVHAEHYAKSGLFINCSLLMGAGINNWDSRYIERDSGTLVISTHSSGTTPLHFTMTAAFKIGWVF